MKMNQWQFQLLLSRNEGEYYDEFYPMDKNDDMFKGYDVDGSDDKFAHSQTREAKEISHFLTQFKNQHSKHRLHVTDTGNLVIQNVVREDKGSYICRATNMVGSKSSEEAILSVHGMLLKCGQV